LAVLLLLFAITVGGITPEISAISTLIFAMTAVLIIAVIQLTGRGPTD
jgi:ABC-type spermidine/putrescine transport system permease subunit II